MRRKGFALIELVVVMGMLAVLTGMITITTLGSQRRASLTATVDTLVADLRSQQTKAMTGVTAGGVTPTGYGVHFESDRYILFHGNSYDVSSLSNSVISIDPRVGFSTISLPNNNIIFAARSGETIGFDAQLSSVTVGQLDNDMVKIIHFNRYGVITTIN